MCITMDLHTHTQYSRHHHGKGTVEENVRAAREKAGIHPWHKLNIKRFSVTRYQ